MNELKFDLRCFYEDKDAIGRRYRRQDAIGTPYCVTVDHQTLQDNTVTIRDRDSMKQRRVRIEEVRGQMIEACSINNLLRKI
jgi:glycyl-tRNA synthetase